jgi:hypothetical protein
VAKYLHMSFASLEKRHSELSAKGWM